MEALYYATLSRVARFLQSAASATGRAGRTQYSAARTTGLLEAEAAARQAPLVEM
jgi:hypothetical protein